MTAPADEQRGGWLREAVAAWDRFWFSRADPTKLGLIRLCCGLAIFYVHLAYTLDLQEFFGPHAWLDQQAVERFRQDEPIAPVIFDWSAGLPPPPADSTPEELQYARRYGIHPRLVADRGFYGWSVWYHVTSPGAIVVTHSLILVILFLFAIGLWTRVTSVLSWLAVVSYYNRSPPTLFGMDTMMNLLLLYTMVGQGGAAVSLDRLIARYRAARAALRAGRSLPATMPPPPSVAANLGLRLIQVNLCAIYFMSGLSKLQGSAWWQGTAVWGTLANPEFSPLYFPPFYAAMRFLCEHRALWELAMTSSAAFTLAMELGFPFFVWVRPLRFLMLGMAVLMHAGIAFFMGLNTFSFMMLCMLLAFVPAETVRRFLRRLGGATRGMRLIFDPVQTAHARAACAVRAADVFDHVTYEEWPHRHGLEMANERLLTVVAEGTERDGRLGLCWLCTRLRPFWAVTLLLRLPGISGGLDRRFSQGPSAPASHAGSLSEDARREKVGR